MSPQAETTLAELLTRRQTDIRRRRRSSRLALAGMVLVVMAAMGSLSPDAVLPLSREEFCRELERLALLDVNLSDARELRLVRGLGPVGARDVVSIRRFLGPFQEKRSLRLVPGIGIKRLQKIQSQVTVRHDDE